MKRLLPAGGIRPGDEDRIAARRIAALKVENAVAYHQSIFRHHTQAFAADEGRLRTSTLPLP